MFDKIYESDEDAKIICEESNVLGISALGERG
jgi:hypothetical protein